MTERTITSLPEIRAQPDRLAPTIDRLRRLSRVMFRRKAAVATTMAEPVVLIPNASGSGHGSPPGKRWLRLTFFGFVLLPTVVAFCYYAFVASRQYVSEVKFVVRGATQGMPIQGIAIGGSAVTQILRMNNNQEGAIISSYIQSEGMLEDLAGQIDLMQVYGRSEIDWLSRLPSLHPFEKATRYWLKMVTVRIEAMGGTLTLRISAFSPEEAQLLTTFVLKRCEDLVNDMLSQARNEAVASSELELRHSLTETATARKAFEDLRDTERLIDADNSARSLLGAESKLRQQKIEIETELTTLQNRLSPDTPVVREANNRLRNIDQQIHDLRDQLTNRQNRDASISDAIRLYERRKFDLQAAKDNQDFADRLLANALRESNLRHVYLETYQPPFVTIKAAYPSPLWETSRFGGALLTLWLIVSLLIVRIREHTD
jgi:capsular polysaccharide transport system permease protein